MKKIRLRTLSVFGIAALSGTVLLHTSQSVQEAEDELHTLQAAIDKEQEEIRVLEAEWEYLNNPERLEKLAKEYLDLEAPTPDQMLGEPADLPVLPPPEEESPLLQNVSQSPPTAMPAEKPEAPKEPKSETGADFNALMNKLDDGGVQ